VMRGLVHRFRPRRRASAEGRACSGLSGTRRAIAVVVARLYGKLQIIKPTKLPPWPDQKTVGPVEKVRMGFWFSGCLLGEIGWMAMLARC
jgi:hypothetical protein